jgi:hypothetical protein
VVCFDGLKEPEASESQVEKGSGVGLEEVRGSWAHSLVLSLFACCCLLREGLWLVRDNARCKGEKARRGCE